MGKAEGTYLDSPKPPFWRYFSRYTQPRFPGCTIFNNIFFDVTSHHYLRNGKGVAPLGSRSSELGLKSVVRGWLWLYFAKPPLDARPVHEAARSGSGVQSGAFLHHPKKAVNYGRNFASIQSDGHFFGFCFFTAPGWPWSQKARRLLTKSLLRWLTY